MSNWHHTTDPHEVIPNGFHAKTNKYTVLGFCSPAGKEVKHLMVNIRYDNGSETTRRYVHTLRDFIVETSHSDYVNHVEVTARWGSDDQIHIEKY